MKIVIETTIAEIRELFLGAGLAPAAPSVKQVSESERQLREQEVHAFFDAFEEARLASNRDVLEKMVHPEYFIIDPDGNTNTRSEMLMKADTLAFDAFEEVEHSVAVHGLNADTATSQGTFVMVEKNPPEGLEQFYQGKFRSTHHLVRNEDGSWQIRYTQLTKVFDEEQAAAGGDGDAGGYPTTKK